MTAEIVIMNKRAVAMAADSAATLVEYSSKRVASKVLNGANKLFALSAHAPIGMMVSGGSEFISVPWDTIIKMYRRNLEDGTFPTLDDYCRDFLTFVGRFKFGYDAEESYILSVAEQVCRRLCTQLELGVFASRIGSFECTVAKRCGRKASRSG